jgi:hypothetical protein
MTNLSNLFVTFVPDDGALKPIKGLRDGNGKWRAVLESSRRYIVKLLTDKLYSTKQISAAYKIHIFTLRKWVVESNPKHKGDQP